MAMPGSASSRVEICEPPSSDTAVLREAETGAGVPWPARISVAGNVSRARGNVKRVLLLI